MEDVWWVKGWLATGWRGSLASAGTGLRAIAARSVRSFCHSRISSSATKDDWTQRRRGLHDRRQTLDLVAEGAGWTTRRARQERAFGMAAKGDDACP